MRWIMTTLSRVIVILTSMFFITPVLATDAAVAYAHYVKGDYADAYREYRGLAEVGYAPYQAQIANMFENGKGVDQDLVEAYAWYAAAASQGNSLGQRNAEHLSRILDRDQLRRGTALAEEYVRMYVAPYRPEGRLRP